MKKSRLNPTSGQKKLASKRAFRSTQRHHVPTWILLKIEDLIDKAKREKDSSKVLYACLESRNLIEMLKFSKIQCSIPEEERNATAERASGQNGLEKENKKLKVLNQKYQDFFQAVSEDANFSFTSFNASQCQKILDSLHAYIHTYTISEHEMIFSSNYVQEAFNVINNATAFVKSNMTYIQENNTYAIANIDVKTLPEWARIVLDAWKQDPKNDYENLKKSIADGAEKYIKDKK